MFRLRSGIALSLVGAAALLAASAAQAGTLTSATWTQVNQGFPMSRTGGQLSITGTSTGTTISANLSYPATSIKFFVPGTAMGWYRLHDIAITITQGGPQALTATPSMASATMGIPGTVIVMTANHAAKGVNQSMFNVGINTLVEVPLSIGKSGQQSGTFIVIGVTNTFTVDFYAWTPGTQVFAGLTSAGDALPSVAAMGSFNLTGGGGGTVTLVSASKVSIDCFFSQRRTATFTSLKMSFVPEPGFLLMLGAGALGLVLVGSRERQN